MPLFLCSSFLALGRVWRTASLCCSHSKVWSKFPITADEQLIFSKTFQCHGSCKTWGDWGFELYLSIILLIPVMFSFPYTTDQEVPGLCVLLGLFRIYVLYGLWSLLDVRENRRRSSPVCGVVSATYTPQLEGSRPQDGISEGKPNSYKSHRTLWQVRVIYNCCYCKLNITWFLGEEVASRSDIGSEGAHTHSDRSGKSSPDHVINVMTEMFVSERNLNRMEDILDTWSNNLKVYFKAQLC